MFRNPKHKAITPLGWLTRVVMALYILLFFIWLIFPVVLVLAASFQGRLEVTPSFANWSLDAYRAIPDSYWNAFWFTVQSSFIATMIALVVAIPAAWAMVRGRLRERRLLSNLVLIPDVVPQLILGIALLTVFLPLGLSNSFQGIILALVALSLAMGLRFTEALLEGLPEEYEQAARTLGADGITTFRKVVVPLLAPGIAISALFIFMQNLITFELLFFISGPSASPIAVRLFTDIVERGALSYAIAMAGVLVYVAIAFYVMVSITIGPKYMAGSVMSRKG